MTRRDLPDAPLVRGSWDKTSALMPKAVEAWDRNIQARGAVDSDGSTYTIDVLEVIGEDPWTGGGVTAAKVSALLRQAGGRDVIVNINSPGGRFFDGASIYNMLRLYDGQVTTRIVGMAASAASIIAMAGDIIQIGRAGFFMIHNTGVGVVADRNGLRSVADELEAYDEALTDIYQARTGLDRGTIAQMMNAETVIGAKRSIDMRFADGLLPSDAVAAMEPKNTQVEPPKSLYVMEALAMRGGASRKEARSLVQSVIEELSGTPSAAADGTPSAADEAAFAELLATVKSTRI